MPDKNGSAGRPLRIIVNADDLGISSEVNSSIFDLMARGRIQSSTILANGPAVQQALADTVHFPGHSFGVHLNITEFLPLTRSSALRVLLDGSGSLAKVIRNVEITASLKQAVFEEWSAQISLLLAHGLKVSHIDSHHHSHTVPELLPVLRALRKRFGIQRARVSINLFRPGERKSPLLYLKKKAFNSALRHVCGFRTPDACADFESFLQIPADQVRGMSWIELMTHPGHPRYPSDAVLLSGEWFRALLCEFVTYEDL